MPAFAEFSLFGRIVPPGAISGRRAYNLLRAGCSSGVAQELTAAEHPDELTFTNVPFWEPHAMTQRTQRTWKSIDVFVDYEVMENVRRTWNALQRTQFDRELWGLYWHKLVNDRSIDSSRSDDRALHVDQYQPGDYSCAAHLARKELGGRLTFPPLTN